MSPKADPDPFKLTEATDGELVARLGPLAGMIEVHAEVLELDYAERLAIWQELTARRRDNPTAGATRRAMADAACVTEAAVGYAFREAAKKAAKADAG